MVKIKMHIINICKTFGIYSRDCYKFLSREFKVGHCGTLDKYAKGVLIVLTHKSTKLSNIITNFDKEYFFTIIFGADTVTNDLFGNIKLTSNTLINNEVLNKIKDYILSFMNYSYYQKCPLVSAKKVNGITLYKIIKKNKNIKLPIKLNYVTIKDISIININQFCIDIYLKSTSGFYVRSFVRDIGKEFSVPTCVYNINRTKVGIFSVSDSLYLLS